MPQVRAIATQKLQQRAQRLSVVTRDRCQRLSARDAPGVRHQAVPRSPVRARDPHRDPDRASRRADRRSGDGLAGNAARRCASGMERSGSDLGLAVRCRQSANGVGPRAATATMARLLPRVQGEEGALGIDALRDRVAAGHFHRAVSTCPPAGLDRVDRARSGRRPARSAATPAARASAVTMLNMPPSTTPLRPNI